MIAVTGEALIDLIVGPGGRVDARPGGGPYNAARTIGRLGLGAVFLGRLSQDRFGRLLGAGLDRDGVTPGVAGLSAAPTTLAVADIGADGAPAFHFHLAGTSAFELDLPMLAAALPAAPHALHALHAGSLALVADPAATAIEELITGGVPTGTLVMVDPNCRPGAIGDRGAYLGRLRRILARADLVKVSTEDLAYLLPGVPAREAALSLVRQGPGLVLVTDGPGPARALLPGHEVTVPVPAVHVADTIGAGDAFGGAFLAWWTGNKLARSDFGQLTAVREALVAAAEVAASTCTRAGAEPPWAADLARSPHWRWLPPPVPADQRLPGQAGSGALPGS